MPSGDELRALADKWGAEGERLFEQSYRGENGGSIMRDAMTVTLSELCKDFAASLRALAQPTVPQP